MATVANFEGNMKISLISPHPFGTEITTATLKTQFDGLRHWEDCYRQLILLGNQLPVLPGSLRRPEIALSGCENPIWFGHQVLENGTLHFYGDSEGRIVRGLLALILTAIEGQRPTTLLQQDALQIFEDLSLRKKLSASRNSGLEVLSQAVKRAAQQANR